MSGMGAAMPAGMGAPPPLPPGTGMGGMGAPPAPPTAPMAYRGGRTRASGGRAPGVDLTKAMPGSASSGEGRLAQTKYYKKHGM